MAGWTVVNQTPDTPPASKWIVKAQEPESDNMSLGRLLLGNAELGGSAIANIPHGLLHAGADIVRRVQGNYEGEDPGWIDALHVPQGEAGEELARKVSAAAVNANDQAGASDLVTKGVGAINEAAGAVSENAPFVSKVVAPLAGDVATLAGARAPIQGAIGSTIGATRAAFNEASGAGEIWHKAGLRTGGGHPIARQVAGESGPEALRGHNTQIGNTVSAAEAGHDLNAPISYESLAGAREAPSAVYNRVAHNLPEGKPDAAAAARIQNAGVPEGGRMSKGSPQAQQQIADLKAQLLDPDRTFTGQQMVNEMRGLRQEGFVNAASEDVSNQQLGKAQLEIARALEDHVGRNLPKGGDVSLDQFRAARTELAKNHAVESALRGNDVDPRALGRIHRNNPTELTGGLKMLAEFAEGPGKEVVGLPERYNPPGVLSDVAGIANIHRPVQSTVQGLPGIGSAARKFLTGSTGSAIDRAQAMFPGRQPGAFDPLAGLRPPPGFVGRQPPIQGTLGDLAQGEGPPPFELGVGANPNPAVQAPMGDFAKVLSEGLEQPGAPGLSVGPMGLPQGEGLPFQASPEAIGARPVQGGAPKLPPRVTDDYGNLTEVEPHEQASTPLGNRFANEPSPGNRPGPRLAAGGEPSLGDLMKELQDYAGVASQGVPEGIATRTNPLTNNASGESAASVEAINRGNVERAAGQDRFLIDPDGKLWPVRGVEAADATAPKGSIIVQKGVGKDRFTILDRGGLPHSHAKGLLNRALGGGTGLNLGDLLNGE